MPFLDWVNKNQAVSSASTVPYHLLQLEQTHGDAQSAQDNLIIQGDNLQALKALLPFYTSKVKCIFIDPPYNTGSAFEHYDDKLEHSQWLSMMYPRLVLLRELLSDEGFIIVHIDDNEGAYLKVLLDEIFGRRNFLTTFFSQVRYGNKTLAEDNAFQKLVEYAYVYAKEAKLCKPVKDKEEYKVEKFEWKITELTKGTELELGGKRVEVFQPEQYKIEKITPALDALKETWATGSLIKQSGSSGEFLDKYLAPRKAEDGLSCMYKVYGIGEDGYGYRYFTGPKKADATKGKFYSGIPLDRLKELEKGNSTKDKPIVNFYDLAGSFGNCRQEGGVDFRSGKKPEVYLQTILNHFSLEGDLVLDSFLGSGSTAATAHKMGRRYIGIEMGEHAQTHCIPRLQKVIEGEHGGISKAVNWQGGGGFSFYTLGEAVFDASGHISANVRFSALAAYIWLLETKTAIDAKAPDKASPFIGEHEGVAYYLLYNGILGDRRPNGGNVLTNPVLAYLESVHPHQGKKVIFGEASRIGEAKLNALGISFKQIPYELHERV